MINLNASMDSVLINMAGRPGQLPIPLNEGVSQSGAARRTLHAAAKAAKRHPHKRVAPRPADYWHNVRRTRAGHMPSQLDYGQGQNVGLVSIHNAQQLVTLPPSAYK